MTAARLIRAPNFTLQRTGGLASLALRPLSVAFGALVRQCETLLNGGRSTDRGSERAEEGY